MEDNEKNSAETTLEETKEISEVADTDTKNEVEFTEENSLEEETNEEVKQKPQKTNADYARERRKQEQEALIKKTRYDAIIEALNGVNPYTKEKMEDSQDVEEYLNMKQIEKSGKDPVWDYSKFLKEKAKEQQKYDLEKQEEQKWVENDRKNFKEKYPDVNLNELVSDDMFRTFANGKVGKMSMEKIYSDYQTFVTLSEERAKNRTAQLLANNASTPGKLSNETTSPKMNYNEMSSAEFEKIVERVKRGERI